MPDNLIPKVPEIKIEVNSALNKIPLSDDDKNQLKPVLSQLAPDA